MKFFIANEDSKQKVSSYLSSNKTKPVSQNLYSEDIIDLNDQVIAYCPRYEEKFSLVPSGKLSGKELENLWWGKNENNFANTFHLQHELLLKGHSAEMIIRCSAGNYYRLVRTPIYSDDNKKIENIHGCVYLHSPQLNRFAQILFSRYNISYFETRDLFVETLSTKARRIASLLVLGFNVTEIARLFNISRSMVNKILLEQIAFALGENSGSSKILLDKLVSVGYSNFLPYEFYSAKMQAKEPSSTVTACERTKLIIEKLKSNYSISETAKQMSISPSLIYHLMKQNQIPINQCRNVHISPRTVSIN